ncbi:MAG: PEP-CTERM sorting domain-containing protein [Fimbriimonadaceae bacterium]|nr:PEP-CTERM sorting domain-containing protein [Fimbriimonadaceae bacterium]QYK57374.1 MAG: PEP-CTERM sorting domain-containing protein [Fimbriimonadaceae bacterium]
MKNSILTIVALGAVCATSFAQWQRVPGYNSMDHGHSVGNTWLSQNLSSMSTFGSMQIIPGFSQFNSTVVDDFVSNGVVTDVGVMFEATSPNFKTTNIRGWRVSVWRSPTDAGNSSANLDQFAVATTFVPNSQVTYAQQFGTGATSQAYSAEMGVNFNTGVGQFWIGMAPEHDFQVNGQTFILQHNMLLSLPNVLGAGTAFDSWAVNPGNGFGMGPLFQLRENAAYGVNSVPEPGLMMALGLGIAALARRRRNAA